MAGRRYCVKLAGDGVNHTQHIHCYEKENPMVFDMLSFRGYVRMDRESFERYKGREDRSVAKIPAFPGGIYRI